MRAVRLLLIVAFVGGTMHLLGCAAGPSVGGEALGIFFEDEIERLPGLQSDVTVVEREGALHLLVRAAVPRTGLSFREASDGFVAELEVRFSSLEQRTGDVISTLTVRDTVTVSTFAETRIHSLRSAQAFLPAIPGLPNLVEVAVIDATGQVGGSRRELLAVPDSQAVSFVAPPILVHGTEPLVGSRLAVWGYEPPARVLTEVIGEDATPSVSLLRYPTDAAVANPPHWTSPGRGSLAYLGVRFDQAPEDSVSIAHLPEGWLLPPVEAGAYRLVASHPGDGVPSERMLLVMPGDHPRIETLDGLVDALAYLAFPSEIEHIRSGITVGERRRRFDAFWGGLLEDRRVAESVMRRYYERVEEANERYSSHKPGWMTDRGMIFIILGRPEVVERTPETETWHYAFGQPDQTRTFVFDRVLYPGISDGSHHHVLRRAARYETVWHDAIRSMRQGSVAY